MLNLNSKLKIGQIELKNRVVVPSMASQTADNKGFITENTLNYYKRLTCSGASLVMVEYSFVHISGRSEPNQLSADDDDKIEGLTQIAESIQSSGAIAGLQLTHGGGKASSQYSGGRLISPSGIAVPTKGSTLETPDIASFEDIQLLKNSFIDAARRAYVAGFGIVEIHSAHGYGLNQWLSPVTNKRRDFYGGSLEHRSRLLFEIIEAIRLALPSMIISVRLPGMDHFEGGLSIEDSKFLSQKLVEIGVQIINVSSGIGGWMRPGSRQGEGYLVSDATEIQSVIDAPVIGVGGIKSAKYINESLNKKRFSLAAVGRAILESPKEWRESVGLMVNNREK